MCNHKKTEFVDRGYHDEEGFWISDLREEERWATEDLDTHRYFCTLCGLVMYYSERARAYYEDGVGELNEHGHFV